MKTGIDVMTFRHSRCARGFSVACRLAALVSIAALLSGNLAVGVQAQRAKSGAGQAVTRLTEEQRILHVLNRLGFGPRPGDIARVKALGLESYINQQLNPQKISDAAAEAKVKNLASLNMTTAELYEKFPQPGLLLRQLERRGELPAALAAARDNRVKGSASALANDKNATDTQMKTQAGDSTQKDTDKAAANKASDNGDPRDNQKYRQAIREYYMQNGLQPPQRITAELQASRILRAVYSERQLQEVMVDFWTNHFNVFAGKGADRWLLISYDRDTIRPHTVGKFYDLLLATAQSPAMLFYLDNFQSVSPNANMRGAGARLGQQRPQAQRGGLLDLLMGGAAMRRNQGQQGANLPRPQQQAGQQQQQQRAKRGINENY